LLIFLVCACLLLKADDLSTPKELDELAAQLAIALGSAIETVKKLD
jgi:hypothetical protein